jgi:hypothetical protein
MYNYATKRLCIFSEEGVKNLLKIRRKAEQLIRESGAFKMINVCDPSWEKMACVDFLVELKVIREIGQQNRPSGQDRVFVAGSSLEF